MNDPSPNENVGADASLVGPIRDPDACVLACPDCSCRRRLEEHLVRCDRDLELATDVATITTS